MRDMWMDDGTYARGRASPDPVLLGLPSLPFHALHDLLNRWRFSSFFQPMLPER